ncbi:MAG: hypothetical protein HY291_14310 [Planctomycetes bacterium]|nr:hypothetical protein [Planctomycetota bacterium]
MIRTRAAFVLQACMMTGLFLSAGIYAAERREVRVLYDFEDGAEVEELKAASEGVSLDVVQDNGVTSGKNCLRVVGKAGGDYAVLMLKGDKLKEWGNFDYFAMDVYTERDEKMPLVFELWDSASKNYPTRCTYEESQTHVGKNTMIWRINRSGRNGKKDGLSWEELKPQDKINLNDLKLIKIFFPPFKAGGNTVIWVDKLRLMQEDAVVAKVDVKIPEGAKAFDFGLKGSAVAGFTNIEANGPGVSGQGVHEAGKAWPDPLTGDGLESDAGPFQFDVDVPDGEYCVWISAGKVINEKTWQLPYQLIVGDQTLCDEKWTDKEFFGEKGLFRHLRTQYSQRPNALWLDYVLPVAPEQTVKAKATNGKLTVKISNHRLSALVVAPAKDEEAFKKACDEIHAQRIKVFYNPLYFDPHDAPKKAEGDGSFALWVPDNTKHILPWVAPSEAERKAKALDLKAAQGQRLVTRVCVTAFDDLGTGDIELSDLSGPGTIPASSIRRYYENYRVAGTGVDELAVLPWTKIRFEPGITWAYWLWMEIPGDAKPGSYKGTLTFKADKGGSKALPIELEIYPFKLDDNIPVSYGMYYGPWGFPASFDRRKLIKEQLAFMREVGFTGVCVGSGDVTAINGGKADVKFDPFMFELAKEAGMGRRPEQMQMGGTLGFARKIARTFLGMGAEVDHNPGSEFGKPELKGLYQDAIKQYKAFIDKMGLPVAVETVDEPREVPNPWNRNAEQTNTYSDWIHEAAGLKTFVTPMGDSQGGKDYTTLVDHHDIVSVHAFAGSKKMIEKTKAAPGKLLWFYNTGKDRLSWGFYAWRMGVAGRWEWHWSSDGGGSADGYPAEDEPYTSFTGCAELAMRAPYGEYPGGFLFKSAYLNIAQGITDYTYLYNLEQALEGAKNDAAKAKTVADAQAFLDALKKSIPEYPGIKGMASPDAGALVGAGLDTPAAALCEAWRRKIGEFLIALKK